MGCWLSAIGYRLSRDPRPPRRFRGFRGFRGFLPVLCLRLLRLEARRLRPSHRTVQFDGGRERHQLRLQRAVLEWLQQNISFFECPDREVEEIYYFRWWSFRKHIVQTTNGFVITEFLTPVRHAGIFNTISCAAGFHLAEGRWLRDGRYLDGYTLFWLRGNGGKPQPHFHKFSSWFAAAACDRYLVNGDTRFIAGLLDDLVADYRVWNRNGS